MEVDLGKKVRSANEEIASCRRKRSARAGRFAVGGGPGRLNCGAAMKLVRERQEAKLSGSLSWRSRTETTDMDEPRGVALEHPSARVGIEPLADGKRRVTVVPKEPLRPILRNGCVTSYSIELIRLILEAKGPASLCDEIARDEDSSYTAATLAPDILAYVAEEDVAHRAVVDFGCGCGASTVILARMFPRSRIIGIDYSENPLGVAQARARHHGMENITFLKSSSPLELPENTGRFDYLVLSSVYEHLLPGEREVLLPIAWSRMKPGGIIFVSQTQQRWFPVEAHTTHLPLINYFPQGLALLCARRFSPFVGRDATWERLSRAGIRGATAREILAILRRAGGGPQPILMRPRRLGLRSRTDLWYAGSTFHSYPRVKRLLRLASSLVESFSGVAITPYLSLAIQKRCREPQVRCRLPRRPSRHRLPTMPGAHLGRHWLPGGGCATGVRASGGKANA